MLQHFTYHQDTTLKGDKRLKGLQNTFSRLESCLLTVAEFFPLPIPPSQFCRFIKSRSAAGSNLPSVETDQLRERHPDPCVTPIVTPRESACGYQPGTRAQRGLAEEPGGAGAGWKTGRGENGRSGPASFVFPARAGLSVLFCWKSGFGGARFWG